MGTRERLAQELYDNCLKHLLSKCRRWEDKPDKETTRLVYACVDEVLKSLAVYDDKIGISDANSKIDECIDFWNYESGAGYSVCQQAAVECWKVMIAAI